MNDTRNKYKKQIVELIEPYMEKIITWWLLFERNWKIQKLSWDSVAIDYVSFDWHLFFMQDFCDNHRIIGHYDITAVLKYIRSFLSLWISTDEDTFFIFIWTEYFSFPIKPLHLYTEKEEQELVDLILKLKQWQQ
jgi:hypothetical protein